MSENEKFMQMAINEAYSGIKAKHGGPFGCVIVKDGKIVGRGHNRVVSSNDVTAHGEITAIRDACKNLNTFNLSGCELYTTHYPCPMCKGAIEWARIKRVYYGCNIEDTEQLGFDDKRFYEQELLDFTEVERQACLKLSNDYDETEHQMY